MVAWLLGAVGLLLSLSRGGWLGLLVAIGVFVVFKASKKLLIGSIVAGVIGLLIIMAVPNFRYRVLLPFYGEKSTVARFSLWDTGWKMIKDNPVAGKGLMGFGNNWYGYNTDPGLDHYNFPHNIVLNFWVDTGLLGVVSMIGIFLYGIFRGIKYRSNLYALGFALALIAIFVHGLIDIPYFKNDLALMFWMLWSLSVIPSAADLSFEALVKEEELHTNEPRV